MHFFTQEKSYTTYCVNQLRRLVHASRRADAEVTAAGSTEGPAVKGRTNADGRVTLKIDREGAWLIKTVHMAKSTQPDARLGKLLGHARLPDRGTVDERPAARRL
jgi:hypothetical protein